MTKIPKILCGLAGTLALAIGASAPAQPFPAKPVRIVFPLAAGSPVEPEARTLVRFLESRWGQAVVLEHRPGGGTAVGAAAAARSAPDGYTILYGTGSLAAIKVLQPSGPVDPIRDFTPIAIANEGPASALVSNRQIPARSWSDFVAWVKANPGKVNYASLGGAQMLVIEAIKLAEGMNMTEIRYPGGGAQYLTAILRNDVQLGLSSIATVRSLAEAGSFQVLLALSDGPIPGMPDLAHTGGLRYSNVRSFNWFALLGPAGLPAAIVEKISGDVAAYVKSPEVREREKAGLVIPRFAGPEETRRLIETDANAWAATARAIGFKPE